MTSARARLVEIGENEDVAEVPEVDATPEDRRQSLLERERDLLGQLLAAAEEAENETEWIEIERTERDSDGQILRGPNGQPVLRTVLRFPIRVLSEAEIEQCSRRMTKYVRRMGRREVEDADQVRYRSLLIYTATANDPETGRKVWDEPGLRDKLRVAANFDVIDKVLKPGEKLRVVSRVYELSGYSDTEEEDAKN